jgi:Fe2+ transport system protein FeoA
MRAGGYLCDLLIEVNGGQLAIDRPLAERIVVGSAEGWRGSGDASEPLAAGAPVPRARRDALRPGQRGVVVRGGGAARRRGRVTMRHAAPLGDPIELEVKGYWLSLRRADAREIVLEVEVRNAQGTVGRHRVRPESADE